MLKVMEVATQIGVSKVTIYKKLNALHKELKPFIHKRQNITYLDVEAVEIIRQSLPNYVLDLEGSDEIKNNSLSADVGKSDDVYDKLHAELEMKNRQIRGLLERIKVLESEHIKDLKLLESVLEAQTSIKKREIEDKITILNGYKDIIGYNKERIRKIEESAYNLFK